MKAITLSLCTLFFGGLVQAQVVPTTATASVATTTPAVAPVYPSAPVVNAVRSWQLQKPLTDASLISPGMAVADAGQQIQYMDGLGRPVQTVSKALSPGGKDLVSPVYYDGYGRSSLEYLPYAATTSDGGFKTNPYQDQASFMQQQYGTQGEQFFYGQTLFDNSPLDRPVKELAAGNSWSGSGKGVETTYDINEVNEVRVWKIDLSAGALPSSSSYYDAGALMRTVIKDEQGKRTVEYKDKTGQVVLKKVEIGDSPALSSSSGWLCTYYVYDDMYRLRFVLSPKATIAANDGTVTNEVANGLCFRYEYDARGRIILKKMPDAAEVYMIYDARDRLVFTQDGNMRSRHQWLVNLYDALDRVAVTGMMTYTGTRAALTGYAADPQNLGSHTLAIQGSVTLSANLLVPVCQPGKTLYQASSTIDFIDGFSSDCVPELIAEIADGREAPTYLQVAGNPLPSGSEFIALTQNFYDDYGFTQKTYDNSNNSKLGAGSDPYPESLPSSVSHDTRSLAVGSKAWVLEDPNDLAIGHWLETVNFLDDQGRVVQTQSDNEKGGLEKTTTRYSFSGKVLSTYQVHENPESAAGPIRILTSMDYDAAGRLLSVSKKMNDAGATKIIAQSQYDELGQLKNKNLGNGLQSLDYEYNIRGWLTAVNKDYVNSGTGGRFGQTLSYDYGFSKQQYNGNIAGAKWRSVGDGVQRAYGYDYDAANRLMSADYRQYESGWSNTDANFNVKMGDGIDPSTAYDANGNILRMQQWGLTLAGSVQIDDLHYTYVDKSNRLLNVIDFVPDPVAKLGDFHTSALHPQKNIKDLEIASIGSQNLGSLTDYKYDDNGNMIQDRNKDMVLHSDDNGIVYNHLNLPALIYVKKEGNASKGTIKYIYDAVGNKLQKIVREEDVVVTIGNTSYHTPMTTTTDYIGSFLYESKSYDNTSVTTGYTAQLQAIGDEEGRIRPTTDAAHPFAFDYFIKDHLGNVRMVLTDEEQVDEYPVASLEDSKLSTEKKYYAIDENQIVYANTVTGLPSYTNDNGISNNPSDSSFEQGSSQKLYKLNSNSAKTGLGITLKVMAGDRIDIFGKSYYFQNNTGGSSVNSAVPVLEILNGLVGGAGGAVASGAHEAVTGTTLSGLSATTSGITSLLSSQSADNALNDQKPNAYINYIIFDEQFRYVSGNFSAIGTNGIVKDHHSDFANINIPKNGFVYIYCSNESPVNVFFDNLQVIHTRGPVLEETHYYPFGLRMESICSKSAGGVENKYQYAGKERQAKEFSDGSGLEYLDFGARNYDPETGRFFNQDKYAEKYYLLTPYQYAANNPILFMDNHGDSLVLTGEANALSAFNQTVNDGLGGFYTAKQDEKGNTTLEATHKKGKMTKKQRAFYNTLNGIIGLDDDVNLGVVQGSKDIIVGSYKLESVDINDIQAAKGNSVLTPQSLLGHELQEQKAKQIDGKLFKEAHEEGIGAEDRIGGYTRSDAVLPSSKTSQDVVGNVSGNIDQKFTKGGKTYIVSVNLTENNVTSVKSKLANPPSAKKKK